MTARVMATPANTINDTAIAKIGLHNGAKIIDRPKSISGDDASTESALLHALENIDNKPDVIILLQPTSPLRPKNNLDKVLEHFFSNNYDSLLSISPTHRFFWEINDKNAIPKYDFNNRPRRQDIKENYVENGAFYISYKKNILDSKLRYSGNIGCIEMPLQRSFQIDTYDDLKLIKKLL